jgi:hypothetical protein
MLALAAAFVLGPSQFKYRWVYIPTNLFVKEQVEKTIALIHRAGKAGYNGVAFTDSKLESLDTYPDFYRKSMRQVLDAAKAEHMEFVPFVLSVGWADAMLHQNPSLIESMPCRQVPFVARSGKLVLDKNPLTKFENGDFESAKGDTFAGFAFQDGPGKTSFADHEVVHSGNASLRIEDPGLLTETQGNCRVMQKVTLDPWHQYRLSVWVKSQDFDRAGDVRAIVLDSTGKSLSYGDIGVQATQDWTHASVVFNSQNNSTANVYLGVWGGNKGKLWFDDAKLEDVGLLNVTRRAGCPLTIKSQTGMSYSEVRDVAPIADPKFGNVPWVGEFEFAHDPPEVSLSSNTRIRDGQRVLMDYYCAASTDSGKTALCLSDPASIALMKAVIKNVDELIHPDGFFLSHDEIRIMNWDEACTKRGLTPGELLADNVRNASKWIQEVHPAAQTFIWSDMFDPSHNAVESYYLCNGPLLKSWEGLQKGTVVVNWNSGKPQASLSFFAKRGFNQILAGYYDAPVDGIKDWLKVAQSVEGVQGVMYTTWAGNYNDLEAFAKAAWGD